jgi:hypothetical protein
MIGQIEAAVFIIIIYLLVFAVFDLRLRKIFTFWGVVLLRLAFLKWLTHLELFYYYIF